MCFFFNFCSWNENIFACNPHFDMMFSSLPPKFSRPVAYIQAMHAAKHSRSTWLSTGPTTARAWWVVAQLAAQQKQLIP
jgi:hypothetical protein